MGGQDDKRGETRDAKQQMDAQPPARPELPYRAEPYHTVSHVGAPVNYRNDRISCDIRQAPLRAFQLSAPPVVYPLFHS